MTLQAANEFPCEDAPVQADCDHGAVPRLKGQTMNGCQIIKAILRFEQKLETHSNGCRVWTGAITRGGTGRFKRDKRCKCKRSTTGYGKFWVGPGQKDTVQAHVFAAYIAGKIPSLRVPDGMHLDHFCDHATLCVDCTELVPAAVNLERRHSRPLVNKLRLPPKKLKKPSRRGKRGSGNLKKFARSEESLLQNAAI